MNGRSLSIGAAAILAFGVSLLGLTVGAGRQGPSSSQSVTAAERSHELAVRRPAGLAPVEEVVRTPIEDPPEPDPGPTLADVVREGCGADAAWVLRALREKGLDPEALRGVPRWTEVEDDAFAEAFEASDEQLASWESLFAGRRLFTDGEVRPRDLEILKIATKGEVTEGHIRAAQEIVDEDYPELREAARTAARDLARAQVEIWETGRYRRAPHVSIPQTPGDPRASSSVVTRGAVVRGWHVGYEVDPADHPALEASLRRARELRDALHERIRGAVHRYEGSRGVKSAR